MTSRVGLECNFTTIDDFDFPIVNFQFKYSNIPAAWMCSVCQDTNRSCFPLSRLVIRFLTSVTLSVPQMQHKLFTIPPVFCGFVLFFLSSVLSMIVCIFVLFLLVVALFVLHGYTAYDYYSYPFGILKLFLT